MTRHNPIVKKLREKKFQQKIVENKKGKGAYKRKTSEEIIKEGVIKYYDLLKRLANR